MRWHVVPVVVLVVATLLPAEMRAETTSVKQQLVEDLFKNYSPWVEPRSDPSESVEVDLTLSISMVYAVNEKSQTVTLNGWLLQSWTDDFLNWANRTEYLATGIEKIVISADKIWTPQLAFFEGVSSLFFDTNKFPAEVNYYGSVDLYSGGPLTLACQFNLTYFPMDSHNCTFVLSSWSHDTSLVQLKSRKISLSRLKQNDEWNIDSCGVQVDDGSSYSQVRFCLRLRRKPLFYIMNIIVPTVMLSVLSLLVFCVPPTEGEKISLALTVLLSYSVWLLMLTDRMPSSSDGVPLVGAFLTAFMVISSLSVVAAVIVLRVHWGPHTHPPPNWANALVRARHCSCCHHHNKAEAVSMKEDIETSWAVLARTLDDFFFVIFVLADLAVIVVVLTLLFINSTRNN